MHNYCCKFDKLSRITGNTTMGVQGGLFQLVLYHVTYVTTTGLNNAHFHRYLICVHSCINQTLEILADNLVTKKSPHIIFQLVRLAYFPLKSLTFDFNRIYRNMAHNPEKLLNTKFQLLTQIPITIITIKFQTKTPLKRTIAGVALYNQPVLLIPVG